MKDHRGWDWSQPVQVIVRGPSGATYEGIMQVNPARAYGTGNVYGGYHRQEFDVRELLPEDFEVVQQHPDTWACQRRFTQRRYGSCWLATNKTSRASLNAIQRAWDAIKPYSGHPEELPDTGPIPF